MNRLILPAAVLALLILGMQVYTYEPRKPLPIRNNVPVVQFENSNGELVRSDSINGMVSVWSFFFTSCQGPCPVLQAKMQKLARELAPRSPKEPSVRFVSVSVDPATDTPTELLKYQERMSPSAHRHETSSWDFYRTDIESLKRLALDGFELALDLDDLTHSSRFVLVDQQGRVRGTYDAMDEEKLAQLKADARYLSQN